MNGRVLVVDDDVAMCRLLVSGLAGAGFEAAQAGSADEALALFAREDFDTVITDVRMRGTGGIELCGRIVESRPDVPVIVITAFGSMDTAVEAMRAGAYDFVTKPFKLDLIRLTVERAVRHRQMGQRIERLEHALEEGERYEELIGRSPPMRKIFDLIDRVANAMTPVLVRGESGTGKELVARALHARSDRKAGPFVALNCAAMPVHLLESELFGHVRGAFTDARSDRPGLFVAAAGGTMFLDEIGELPLELQPKLLRALQQKTVRPVGSDIERPFDARIIAATNRDLEAAVEAGSFREDLYYRIHVIELEIPPLRARDADVLILAQHFLEQFAKESGKAITGFTSPAADKLAAYNWPGNVRELQNCVERAATLARFDQIAVDDLPDRIREHRRPEPLVPADPAEFAPMEEIERRYVLRVYESTGRNKSLTARILGFNRKTLYRKLVRYGVLRDTAPPGED
jgi:two-component system, NtrC family, response regulator AtoC